MNGIIDQQAAPFQSRRDGVIPFGFFVDFLEFLKRNEDLVEVITYADLDWGDDWDYGNNYLTERENWGAALRDGRRDPGKIYLLLQHDVDSHPERTINAVRAERSREIRSNIMIFNRRVDRQRLARDGEVVIKHYDLDRRYLKEVEAEGFVIGYHCNALEQAGFDRLRAEQRFIVDVEELAQEFNLQFFSPHGGVRGPDGNSNAALEIPSSLRHRLRWVHNRYTVRVDGNYSDGGINGMRRAVEERDPRDFVRKWLPGKRYRILFHPQYFHSPYSETKRLLEAPWYREVLMHYGRGAPPATVWPDSLLDVARKASAGSRRQPVVTSGRHQLWPAAGAWLGRIMRRDRGINDQSYRPLNPIIVGGDGRSGTTLLNVILDSHPTLAVGSELHFNGKKLPNLGSYIEECLAFTGSGGHLTAADERLKPGIQFINRCDRSGIAPTVLAEAIRATRAQLGTELATFSDRCELVRSLGEYSCMRKGATRWGFKIMREVKNLQRYGEVWPEACYIHIIRDGRDVAASQIKEHGSWGYSEIEKAAEGWVGVIEGARRSAEGLKYREIKYEDLVLQPAQTLERLIAWIGEPWDDALLRHNETPHALFDTKVRHPSRNQVAQPINRLAVGRYMQDLTSDQICRFENIAGELLDDLGYKRQHIGERR